MKRHWRVPFTGTRTFFSGPEAMMSSSPIRCLSCSTILRRTRSRWCRASRVPCSWGSPSWPTTVMASAVEQVADVVEQVGRRPLVVARLLAQHPHHLVDPLGLVGVRARLGDRHPHDVLELVEEVLLDAAGQ